MTKHYAHFVKRRIIPYKPNRWEWLQTAPEDRKKLWFDLVQDKFGGFDRPSKHVTRSKDRVVTGVQPDDFIWLFSQIQYRNKLVLPPSLDAIIEVKEKSESAPIPGNEAAIRTEFIAGELSEWHRLSDWGSALEETQVQLLSGRVVGLSEIGAKVGNSLQSMRLIHEVAPLKKKLEIEKARSGYDFISYRHCDGLPKAIELAKELVVEQKKSVWLDRWCLPRRLAEGREALSNGALEAHVQKKIYGAKTVWGIETNGYNTTNAFTQRERCWAGDKYSSIEASP